ncbi:Vacuolar fusion protein mon1b [Actinomortierella ambigua]|uniref:Vacuolar fusion protein MON1 n=1 Tax=Actinomortierella ambigua TaxID=1343610 RepID=A0A9P6QH98_9FUNG|nr:Vacuolar fusion protein mon1b [Actinomortierella ambigua]KAG0266215.1 Vacuolar fusion protein mon1b [Actinomortierella ambigua]
MFSKKPADNGAGTTPPPSSMLSPRLSASASSGSSPVQSATSPRLMPTKSKPTTALNLDQQNALPTSEVLLGDDDISISSAMHIPPASQFGTSSGTNSSSNSSNLNSASSSAHSAPATLSPSLSSLKKKALFHHHQHQHPQHSLVASAAALLESEVSKFGSESGGEDADVTDLDSEAGDPHQFQSSSSRGGSGSGTPIITVRTLPSALEDGGGGSHDHRLRQRTGARRNNGNGHLATTAEEGEQRGDEEADEEDQHDDGESEERSSIVDENELLEASATRVSKESSEKDVAETLNKDLSNLNLQQGKLKMLQRQSLQASSNNDRGSPSPMRKKGLYANLDDDDGDDSDDNSNNHGGYKKRYGNEDHTTDQWISHRKHFFILSSAGKPIYARYGDESRISSYMGVIQAIISFFADNDDSIRCINAGVHKFVFLLKPPLYLLCVSRSGESEAQLRDQLGYLYAQIISVLTHAQMTKIFEQRNNFDLRGLISGTEIFLDSLGKNMNTDPGFILSAIQCLTVPRELRDKIGAVLGRAKCKPLLYAILLTPTQLITLIRPRTHSMHPSDLHLIFNLLSGSNTFESSESWTPICLPKFNNKSFLHAYICYIAKRVCMVLISPDKDSFFEMSRVKQKVVEGLEATPAPSAANGSSPSGMNMLQMVEHYASAGTSGGFSVGDTGIPGLRHFLYKSKANVQFTMPELHDPYATKGARRRLFRQYRHMHERMHRKTRPLKLLFHVGGQETMLGWITTGFELYAAFGPLVSKSAVVRMCNRLLKWIRKNEDRLMILSSPSFERY